MNAVTAPLRTGERHGDQQEALDEYFYAVEHSSAGGLRKATKERNAARRDWLLSTLPRLDVASHRQVGVGPVFGE